MPPTTPTPTTTTTTMPAPIPSSSPSSSSSSSSSSEESPHEPPQPIKPPSTPQLNPTTTRWNPFALKNVAAWSLQPQTRPLTVAKAPYTKAPAGHVVIKVFDVAINPIDWMVQENQDLKRTEYPTVLGEDVAGQVVEVGDGVVDLRIGERVVAHCARSPSAEDHHLTPGATGAFQQYVVVQRNAIAQLPSSIRTSVGVVLPLGISTASAGLFQKDFLNLPFPSPEQPAPKPLNRILLIWGGSSSVGSCAIQLAKAAGAIIITTASPKNFAYVKTLGAEEVFDYRAEDVEDQIVKWLQSKTVLGAFHARGGNGAVQTCARIVDRSQGKAIVVSVRGIPDDVPKAVRTKTISASDIFAPGNEVGPFIWKEFLPAALKSQTIVPAPEALIVGEQLRSVQLGLDTQKKGVSAQKVVISYIS